MHYRKITVDDKVYEYVVGRDVVKVKNVGIWPKEQIGEQVPIKCTCGCGESIIDTYGVRDIYDLATRVTPKHIATKIRELVA